MDSPSEETSTPPLPVWIWPIRFPKPAARMVWSWAGLAERFYAGWLWVLAAILAGTVPLLIALPLRTGLHQWVSAVLLFMLLLSAVRIDSTAKGVMTMGLAFVSHCAVAISLAAAYPEAMQSVLPDGLAYWQDQQRWITTGIDREYDPRNWVYAHVQFFVAVSAFGYISAGFIPFVRGFYEVDLMNYYVGQLVAGSQSSGTAVGFGWHTWSMMRGVCYAVLVFELASISLQRITGKTLSTPTRRKLRWGVAIGFFFLDCLLKYFMLEPVRGQLEANLNH